MQLPERVYCADVDYPMAVVGTANRNIIVYRLEQQPQEFKQIESPLKYQVIRAGQVATLVSGEWADIAATNVPDESSILSLLM